MGGLKEQFEFIIVAVPLMTAIMVILAAIQIGKKYIYIPTISPGTIMSQNKTLNEKVTALITEAGYGNVLDVTKLGQIMATTAVVITISLFIRGMIFFGIVLGVLIGILLPISFLYYSRGKRQDKLELQLVDFLNEMGTRMQVSNSTFNAFVDSITNTQYPLRPILERIAKNAQHLKSFELALDSSRGLISSPYYQDFIDAVQIHRETGGDVKELIKMVVEQINNKMVTLKKFKAAMAAINLQLAIIFVAPPLASWLTILQNPDNAKAMFETGTGLLIFFIAVACYVGGVVFSFWLKAKVKAQIS